MRAVIVEDELLVADHLKRIAKNEGIDVIAICTSVSEAKSQISKNPDLFLLDIRLGGETSLRLAEYLQSLHIPFIFITANSEQNILEAAVKTNPQHYITKPFNERDVKAALKLIKINHQSNKNIEIKSHKGLVKIKINSIKYIEADNVYVRLYLERNENLLYRSSLSSMLEILPDFFLQTHRSFIVNINHVTSLDADKAFVENTAIPISRTYYPDCKEAFLKK